MHPYTWVMRHPWVWGYSAAAVAVRWPEANRLFSQENDRVLSPDDLPTLAVFAEVVDRRSFTAAAVGLAKSAISRRIALLEKRMDVRLLRRTTRVVSPTEEGCRLYQHCARLIAAAREADLVLSRTQRDSPVRVSAPVAFAQLHLTAGVAEFLRRQSDATVHLGATDRLVDLVADPVPDVEDVLVLLVAPELQPFGAVHRIDVGGREGHLLVAVVMQRAAQALAQVEIAREQVSTGQEGERRGSASLGQWPLHDVELVGMQQQPRGAEPAQPAAGPTPADAALLRQRAQGSQLHARALPLRPARVALTSHAPGSCIGPADPLGTGAARRSISTSASC